MWYNRAVTAEWVARISEVPAQDETPPVVEEKKKNKKLKKRTKLAEDQPQTRDVNWEHTMMRKALHLYFKENWMNGPDEYFDVAVDEAPKGFDIDPDHWPMVRDLIRQLKKRDAKYKANGEIQYSHDCEKVYSFQAKTKKLKSCLKVDINTGETKKLLFVSAKVDCYTLTAEEVFKKSIPVNSKYVGAMGKTIRDISSKELKTGRREYLSGPFKEATIVDLMNSKIGMNDDMPTATRSSTITLKKDNSSKNGWINTKIDPDENYPKLTATHRPSVDSVGGSCSLTKDSRNCSPRIESKSNAIDSTTNGNQTPRNDAGKPPPSNDAGSLAPSNDAGNKTPSNDAGNKTPSNDAGNRTPSSDAGNQTPSIDAGNQTPSSDPENQNQPNHARNQSPTNDAGYRTPRSDAGNKTPSIDAENKTAPNDAGYQSPTSDAGYQHPSSDDGNRTPRSDAGNKIPSNDAGNKIPSKDAGNRTPSSDEKNRNELTNVRLSKGSGSLLTLKAIRNNCPSPCSHRSFDDLIDDFEKSLGTINQPSAPEGQDGVSSSHSESPLEQVKDKCKRSPVSTNSPSRESLESLGEKSEQELRVAITPYFKDDASLNTCTGSQEAYSLGDSWERSGTGSPSGARLGTKSQSSARSGTRSPSSVRSGTRSPSSVRSGTRSQSSARSGTRSPSSVRSVAIRETEPQDLPRNSRNIFSRLRRGLSKMGNKLRSLNCCVTHSGHSAF